MSVAVGNYDVSVLNILGKGSFGIVYTAQDRKTGARVAVKSVTYKERGHLVQHLVNMGRNELAIFRVLKGHTNIVQLLDHIDDGERHWLVMEYCDLGDVPFYMSKHPTDSTARLKIMFEAINGMAYMHCVQTAPIVHRDIKPWNILMMKKGNQDIAKITDFGIGKLYEDHPAAMHETMTTLAGTAAFMAPEFFSTDEGDLRYRSGVDTFAMGLVFHSILDYDNNSSMVPTSSMF